MARAKTTVLVANAAARTGAAESSIETAVSKLEEAGLHPEFFPTQAEGGTVTGLAARLEKEDVARVVYLGGDGTFADSAKAIILARERTGIDLPLGMIPMGTANDQGRSFGIEAGAKALDRNIEIIGIGHEQWLDAGRIEAFDPHGQVIETDLFFDNCGFGLTARILAQRNRDLIVVNQIPIARQVYRDKLAYAGAAFASLFKSVFQGQRFSCEVSVDGEVQEQTGTTDIVINNTKLFGGEWLFTEESQADDGRFEVLNFSSHAEYVASAIKTLKHNPMTESDLEVVGLESVRYRQGKEIEVRLFRRSGQDPVPAQIDGEEFVSADHYRVEVLHNHLRIVVPEDSRWV